jgi:hypothetical protein
MFFPAKADGREQSSIGFQPVLGPIIGKTLLTYLEGFARCEQEKTRSLSYFALRLLRSGASSSQTLLIFVPFPADPKSVTGPSISRPLFDLSLCFTVKQRCLAYARSAEKDEQIDAAELMQQRLGFIFAAKKTQPVEGCVFEGRSHGITVE